VFVLDRHGVPLQPTTPARARRMLHAGRAVVHRRTPFVIRMKDRDVDGSVVGVHRHRSAAVVPSGKNAGTHVGRVAVRTSGSFNIRATAALIQGVPHRHVRLLQRADCWAYTRQEEGASSRP